MRAQVFYPIYDECLRRNGVGFSVAAISKDEDRHLEEMAAGLERALPDWRRRLEAVLAAEEALYGRFLAAVEAALPRTPMAQFRTLSAADVRGILAAFGIAGYRAHQPIAVGTINTNVRVETDAGPLFLRINEGKSEDDVRREAAIVAHAAARGVPTPVPHGTARPARCSRAGGTNSCRCFPGWPGARWRAPS